MHCLPLLQHRQPTATIWIRTQRLCPHRQLLFLVLHLLPLLCRPGQLLLQLLLLRLKPSRLSLSSLGSLLQPACLSSCLELNLSSNLQQQATTRLRPA